MELRTEIEIEASADEVWRVLTDFASYPDWNPFLVKVEGTARAGERLKLTMSLPDSNREYELRPRLLLCDPPRELRWLGHLWVKGLFDGEHFFRLHETESGRTRVVHGEDISGLFVRFAMSTVSEAARGFVYMNSALKRRVEQR